MIIEERDYRVKAGKLAQFIGLYEQQGLPIQREMLGKFIGFFTTESGELNHVVAWWGYDSLDDRQARWDRMLADPRWQIYLKMVDGLIEHQQTRYLRPTPLSPMR